METSCEAGWREIAESAVQALAVVEDLDPLGDLGDGLGAGDEAPMVHELVLQADFLLLLVALLLFRLPQKLSIGALS